MKHTAHKQELKPVLVLVIASFFFSLMTVFNRLIPGDIGIFFQLFLRTSITGLFFIFSGFLLKDITKVSVKDVPLLLFRGLLFVGDFGCFFIAANHLPLGTTLFLFYAGSITISYLYGFFIFKEKFTKIKYASLFLALLGLTIIYSSGLSSLNNPMALFAIVAGTCFGLGTVTSKNVSEKYSINVINIIAYITAAIISLILLPVHKETFTLMLPLHSWIIFLLFALISVIAFYTTVWGFKYIEVQKASLILLGELVFVIILGFIFYHETPTIASLIGGVFILLSLALPNIYA